MQHYICTGGCGVESSQQGVCEAQFCKKEGEPLTECNCADGLHENPGLIPDEDDDDADLGE